MDLKSGTGVASSDEVIVGDLYAEPKVKLPATIKATNVTIKAGSSPVTLAQGGTLSLTVSGTMTVEPGAVLDVSNLGYAGGATLNSSGSAPSGVAASSYDAGGSHGGLGSVGGYVGPAYDSVYQPQLAGGGGSLKNTATGRRGGNGGGALILNAGQLVLDGQIWAKGEQRVDPGNTDSSGAGGGVSITAVTMSGTGAIDASGGAYNAHFNWGGSGGGGRVALNVGTLSGFDPVTQVKTWGGTLWDNTAVIRYASPGTVLIKTSADSYGRLVVDNGKESSGGERTNLQTPLTPLPALGTGAVTAFQTQGVDAWVTASAAFKPQWAGAWMALLDSTGAVLGSYPVASIDGTGRVLLKGAGGVTGASQYRGQYRFDRMDLKSGAGVASGDEVIVGDLYAESKGRLPATVKAANVTIKAGSSPVTLAQGGTLSLTVSGTMTVESGAVLDVSYLGYAGGAALNAPGLAPSLVTASAYDAGGSHGGLGSLGGYTGPAGEIYDSVYQPQYAGGGGSLKNTATGRRGGNGGGALILNVGQLVLNGQIWAKGEQRADPGSTDSSGAGGTVLVTADTVSGAGTVDASGGSYNAHFNWGGSGGGGRVVLYAGTFSGFDPVTQVKTRGGVLWDNTAVIRYASPGTVFVKLPSQTYGKLYVDQGGIVAGKPIVNTTLPAIGTGTVGTATVDALTPTALWITPSSTTAKFSLGVIGMWVKINGSYYRVVDQTPDRRQLLLAGAAGAVQTGDTYRGVYRFDEVIVRGGAKLEFLDDREVTTFTIDSTSSVTPVP
jgi:hypothetical protein